MLDAFNYPSPPFTRTGTPSITRAGTPAPKVGKSSLALSELVNDNDGEEEDNNKDKNETEKGKAIPESSETNGSNNTDNDENTKEADTTESPKDNGNQHDDEDRIAGFGGSGKRKKVVAEPSAASILDNFNF